MKNKIIEHIPHSSLKLPRIFKKQRKLISNEEINNFNYAMTDLLTDKLFSFRKWTHVRAKISRIVCDSEKFLDDKQEIMSKFGMGAIYTKTNKGIIMLYPSEEYKKKIIKNFYMPHHQKLDRVVSRNLTKHKTILVDCHSFSKEIIMTRDDKSKLPDICIGINEFYSSQKLLDFTTDYFKSFGFNVSINNPYSGSMIPDFLLNQNKDNFYSIMLEINRDLYFPNIEAIHLQDKNYKECNECDINNEKINNKYNKNKIKYYKYKKIIIKSEKFKKIKKIIYNYLNFISKMEDL